MTLDVDLKMQMKLNLEIINSVEVTSAMCERTRLINPIHFLFPISEIRIVCNILYAGTVPSYLRGGVFTIDFVKRNLRSWRAQFEFTN